MSNSVSKLLCVRVSVPLEPLNIVVGNVKFIKIQNNRYSENRKHFEKLMKINQKSKINEIIFSKCFQFSEYLLLCILSKYTQWFP
jgi:hypothetical protein